jgi:hypothetical protein
MNMKRYILLFILFLSFFAGRVTGQCTAGINPGNTTICSNTTPGIFTATGGGGTAYTYLWYKDGITTGVITQTYNPGNLTTTSTFYCEITSVECGTMTTPTTTITVNDLLPVSVTIVSDANPVCTGTAVTFTATTINGGSSPSYQWYRGATAVGSNSPAYSYTPSNGDVITVRLSSSETCKSGSPATSNAVVMTVYSSAPGQPGTITGSANVCQGQTDVSYSISDVANASYYEWSAGVGGTIISGQGSTAISVDFAADATDLAVSVRAQNPCGFGIIRSKNITVKLLPTATISGTTTVCQGAAFPHIIFNNPQSRGITITYNIDGINQPAINIAANNDEYVEAPTTTSGTFTYTLVSVIYQTGTLCPNIISGTAKITVTPTVGTPTPVTISEGSDPACQLTIGTTTTTYTTTATNSTGFNWSLSNSSAGSINPSSGVMAWTNGFSGSVNIRVTANGCGTSPQVIRTVNVTPAVGTPTSITVSAGSEPGCQLDNGTTTTTYATTATNSTGFNWSLSNVAAGSINPVTGVMTWANGFSGNVNIQVTASGCGISPQVIRAVNVIPNAGTPTAITISAGSEPTCQLTNGTTTTTYATTATYSTGYNWSLSNVAAGSINPVTGVMTWANDFSGSVNIQVTANGCNSISPQVIRVVSVTPEVGTPTPITVFAGSDPNCQLTSGTTMTIYSTTATNSTGFNWSLSNAAAGSINSASGLMTWANGFSGIVDIRVMATGCGTSSQVTRTVAVNPLPVVTITGPGTPRITSSGNIYETQPGMSGYNWSVSGGGSGTPSGNTFSVVWNTEGNQTVSVNYIDTRGCTATNQTIYSVAVKPVPAASGALIEGYPSVGNTLTGKYTFIDGSTGTDNSTFRWLRNGTDPIPLATGINYVPSMDDVNKTITFEVTPVSSVGPPTTGLSVKSSPTELIEDLTGVPVADEVCIEGIRAAGNTIRGEYRYTFSKAEGISTYRWLRKDIAAGTFVIVGINRQYILVTEDIDDSKEIIFEVTPVSSNLTPIQGAPVQSRPLARILIPKTEYSISEPDVILSANEPDGVFSGSGVSGNIFSPKTAGSAGSPYTLTYLLYIVNTTSSCSQQASKIVSVNPNISSFVGFDPLYCHDNGPDVISVSGVPAGSTDLDFTITDNNGIVAESGTSVTIDPGRMRPGIEKDTLFFSYKYLGTFYQISEPFEIDSVGTDVRIINLDSAYCQGDPRKYVSVEGVYPLGGSATWTGDILSDTKATSAFADPSLGVPGQKYPITYQYTSASGCKSKVLSGIVTINALPDPSFSLNPTYNIDGGAISLVPVQTGGSFTGNGVSGDKLFPDIAGLGEYEIKYTITDTNNCSANLGKKTIIRKAQGAFTDIPSLICYSDTTYNVKITGLPPGITITGFTNTKKSLIYTLGASSADYNVPAAGAGFDTLDFSYIWDGVDYSISAPINVDSIGHAVIRNLTPGQIICDNVAPFELFPSITGGSFTGPVSGSYLDPAKASGPAAVSYTLTNIKTGCSTSITVPVTIFPAPKVAFLPADVCIESNSDTTFFINNTTSSDNVQSWLWEFTGADGVKTSNDKDAGYLYITGGLQKVALTATTINSCSATKESTINLGVRPYADFYWKNDCLNMNDSVILVDTTFSPSLIVSRSWSILGGAEFSTAAKEALYPKTDTGYLTVQYIVRTSYLNCNDTVTKDIYIRPTITVPTDGYFENFEAGNGGWVKGEITGNTWSFGTPDRLVIDSASSGIKAWFTRYSLTDQKIESSSVISPCFDFTAIKRPMISLMLWKRFDRNRDGAALQYMIGDSGQWQYVGTLDDGINWYNSTLIQGRPGGDQIGWTTGNQQDKTWGEARHRLDELIGKKDIKFRIAYGSDGTSQDNDGIAFDDIWIGSRARGVLLEHFTNNSSSLSSTATAQVSALAIRDTADIINIQYHTNFPGSDPYFDDNPGDASARFLFYGLAKVPYSFIDGGTRKNYASIFDYLDAGIDSNDLARRSLINPLFTIELNTIVTGGILTVSGKIKALEEIKSENVTLYFAVTEKNNSAHTGALGETEFYNVFRKFIPDAGGISLAGTWNKDEEYSLTERTWIIEKIQSTADIEVIAFIQNNITKEIYQAESNVKHNVIVGIEDLITANSKSFALYPNPASDRLTVTFEQATEAETDIKIYDFTGLLIRAFKTGAGTTEFIIDNPGLKSGIYIVKVSVNGLLWDYKKLVISEN